MASTAAEQVLRACESSDFRHACDARTVVPLYVAADVVASFLDYSEDCAPTEAMGLLFGFRYQWQGIPYTRVVHWEAGTGEHATSGGARLSADEIVTIRNRVEARGGEKELGRVVGICHSHPFGVAPVPSPTDHATFCSFPYNFPGNAFLLVDPLVPAVRWYVIQLEEASGGEGTHAERSLVPAAWVLVQ